MGPATSLARDVAQGIWKAARLDRTVAALAPPGESRGRVLFSYVKTPFRLKPGQPPPSSHTHFWESLQMVKTFLELGYAVDVIDWHNDRFTPAADYDAFVDARMNLERLSSLLPPRCVKIMHIDTAHWLFHTTAQHQRLLALQDRRGVTLRPRKTVSPNLGIEHADCATMLGNDFTAGTYRYAGKPIYRVPLSTLMEWPWPDDKDFRACRGRFVWIGSGGLVHKGLDLVLEAFTQLPDLHLTVCGPIDEEEDFKRAFGRELYHTPNIETVGWVDVTDRRFEGIVRRSAGVIFPSCSEGGGGSVITCMHAALIPIATKEASVDIQEDFGLLLPDAGLETIKERLRHVAALAAPDLRRMARGAWEYARAHHTRPHFAEAYRRAIMMILRHPAEAGASPAA